MSATQIFGVRLGFETISYRFNNPPTTATFEEEGSYKDELHSLIYVSI